MSCLLARPRLNLRIKNVTLEADDETEFNRGFGHLNPYRPRLTSQLKTYLLDGQVQVQP